MSFFQWYPFPAFTDDIADTMISAPQMIYAMRMEGTDIISYLRSKYIIRQRRISYRNSDISSNMNGLHFRGVHPKNPRSSERGFFYPSRQAWYIIALSRVYHQMPQVVFASYHTFSCFLSAWWYTKRSLCWYVIPAALMIYIGKSLIFRRFYAKIQLSYADMEAAFLVFMKTKVWK